MLSVVAAQFLWSLQSSLTKTHCVTLSEATLPGTTRQGKCAPRASAPDFVKAMARFQSALCVLKAKTNIPYSALAKGRFYLFFIRLEEFFVTVL